MLQDRMRNVAWITIFGPSVRVVWRFLGDRLAQKGKRELLPIGDDVGRSANNAASAESGAAKLKSLGESTR